jgi:methylated-DNA-protein-cysteine methyltransferase-like protein
MPSSDMTEHVERLYRAIYAVVRRIPRGRVATYGQVAELAGIPGGARVAGAAMKVSKRSDHLPWQRVIGKAGRTRGRIAIHDPVGAAVQRNLLDREGVEIGATGLIALDRYGWLPTGAARRPRDGSSRGEPRRRPRSSSKTRASSSGGDLPVPSAAGEPRHSPLRTSRRADPRPTGGSSRGGRPRRRPRSS